MKYLCVIFIIGIAIVPGTDLAGKPLDSLHVRNPDSTRIIMDSETVPGAVRSRSHQMTILRPVGFFPREESGASGYWQMAPGPQYGRTILIHGLELDTRLRPGWPLRYFPQHSLIGIAPVSTDSTGYPLRSHLLERREEPMVDLVYKEGDYGLSAVSVGVATDITDDTHLHLSREGEGFVGQFGIDGLETERYYLGVHHRVSDSTRFLYSTFYARDNSTWTTATPAPNSFGSESSSWYQHLLRWNSQTRFGEWDYGLRLGSQRLWLNKTAERGQMTELQRGGWLGYHFQLNNAIGIQWRYSGVQYVLDGSSSNLQRELWHRLQGGATIRFGEFSVKVHPEIVTVSTGDEVYVLPNGNVSYEPFDWITASVELAGTVTPIPYQWEQTSEKITIPTSSVEKTSTQNITSSLEITPFNFLSVTGGAEFTQYSNWHSLAYNMPAARTDSTLTLETVDGNHTGLFASAKFQVFEEFALGGRYDVYPSVSNILPELWTRQTITGWMQAQRYFFDNNLLLHVYLEGGTLLSRQPVGWNPRFQSLTHYPLFGDPESSVFMHAIIQGQIGAFTISTSFYNAAANNLIYALDQRPPATIFYLGMRWQLWN